MFPLHFDGFRMVSLGDMKVKGFFKELGRPKDGRLE